MSGKVPEALAALERVLGARGVSPTDPVVNQAVFRVVEALGGHVPATALDDAGVPRRRSTDWPTREMGWSSDLGKDRAGNGRGMGRDVGRIEVGGMVLHTLTDGKMVTVRVESGTPGKGVVRTYSRRLGQGQYAEEVVHFLLEDLPEVEAAERELARPRGNHAMMVDPAGATFDPVADGRRGPE